ncbi:MAG: DNA-processing protein DprA [Candidatus Hodarchaeales archaeon]
MSNPIKKSSDEKAPSLLKYVGQEEDKPKNRKDKKRMSFPLQCWIYLGFVNEMLPPRGKIPRIVLDRFDNPNKKVASLEEFIAITNSYKDCQNTFSISDDEFHKYRSQFKLISNLSESKTEFIQLQEQTIEYCIKKKYKMIPYSSNQYPVFLKNIHDPPPILYFKGNIQVLNTLELEKNIAIVGTRNPTWRGHVKAREISSILSSEGYTIISGLARGIDTNAHIGALSQDGTTIAVIGSGLDHIYPAENGEICKDICVKGGIISERSPDMKPKAQFFIPRNRIISGLSLGTVVIEASLKSGTRAQARLTMEQNRMLFVLKPTYKDRTPSHLPNQLLDNKKTDYQSIYPIDNALDILNGINQEKCKQK